MAFTTIMTRPLRTGREPAGYAMGQHRDSPTFVTEKASMNHPGRVLLIESRPPVAEAIRTRLEQDGVHVDVADADHMNATPPSRRHYDSVLLTITLSNQYLLDLLRGYEHSGVPIHVLGVLEKPADREGSEHPKVGVAAPPDSALRRRLPTDAVESAPEEIIRVHDLAIYTRHRTVSRGGTRIALTSLEYQVLECLARNRGHVVSRAEILQCIRGASDAPYNLVQVYIRYLRRKIDNRFAVPLIRTQYGQGYLLRDDLPIVAGD